MRILGISGALRREAYSTALLRHAGELFEAEGAEFEIYGLRDIPPYDQDDDVEDAPAAVARLRAAVAEANALFVSNAAGAQLQVWAWTEPTRSRAR
jgi:chromate reductase, NAD(P)H dehydrogenase (quinone)